MYQRWLQTTAAQPDLYGREFPWGMFVSVGPQEVDQMIQMTPPERLAELKHQIASAPSTDEEWKQLVIIIGGSYKGDSRDVWNAAKQTYHDAIEMLREYFRTHDEDRSR